MGLSMVVAAGWWVAILVLMPASSRPYIGGSQNNSFWNVLFGYNGFGRLTGNETGSVGGGPGGAGAVGADRLQPHVQLLVRLRGVVAAARGVGPARDRTRGHTHPASYRPHPCRAGLWGGWLLATAPAFSFGQGIIHEYYTVALAPALGAMIGIGTHLLWKHRRAVWSRVALVANAGGHGLVAASAARPRTAMASGLGEHADRARRGDRARAGVHRPSAARAAVVAVAGLALVLAVPTAASITTVRTTHQGPLPTSGPAHAGGRSGPGVAVVPGIRGCPRGRSGEWPPRWWAPRWWVPGWWVPGWWVPGWWAGARWDPRWCIRRWWVPRWWIAGRRQRTRPRGRWGLLLPEPGTAVTKLLRTARHGGYRWAAASVGATDAAGFQIASEAPIMAIGGFNGSDPTPTLSEFQQFVRDGDVHYFIAGNFGVPGGGRGGTGTTISQWVQANFASRTVSGVTIYDLSSGRTGG